MNICLIPAFNAAFTITVALDSCREFDRVIVYNDGSTDDTATLAAVFPNVSVIGGQHVGLQAARHALYLALPPETKTVCYLDADDYRLMGALSGHLKELEDVDVLLTAMCTMPDGHLTTPTDVLTEIVGVRFQTGSLLMKRSAMDAMHERLGHTWRLDAFWFLEGVFAWDLYRSGLRFGYSSTPGSVYLWNWSPAQYSAQFRSADRLRWLNFLTDEIRETLGESRWEPYRHLADCQRASLQYLIKRGL